MDRISPNESNMSLLNFVGVPVPFSPLSLPLITLHGKQLQMRYPNQEWIYPGSTIDTRGI